MEMSQQQKQNSRGTFLQRDYFGKLNIYDGKGIDLSFILQIVKGRMLSIYEMIFTTLIKELKKLP